MSELLSYFSYPYVRYAFIVGVLISICSSLLGTILVLKRYSFIGNTLSYVAFMFQTVSIVLGLTGKMYIVLPGTIICAIFLLCKSKNKRNEAVLAMISVGALALGYLIINLFNTGKNVSSDICGSLFGTISILTLTKSEVITCCVLSVFVVISFVFLYNKIFAIVFDEKFAKATGLNTDFYNVLISIIIAVIISLSINLVGSLLISALVVLPTLSAMRIFYTFKNLVIFSTLISILCTLTGLIVSIFIDSPVGATIVLVQIIAFIICSVLGFLRRKFL